jgi:hypothetical protein
MKNYIIISRSLLILSILLYGACLPFDAFCVSGECSQWPSYGILFFGALGLPGSFANLTWIANPILFLSWVTRATQQKVQACVYSFTALIIAMSFLLDRTVVTNEGGIPFPITGYKIGYWIWLTSMAAICLSSLINLMLHKELSQDKKLI